MTRMALWLAKSQLESDSPKRRMWALKTIRSVLDDAIIALNDRIVVSLLIHALNDAEASIRAEAAGALGDLHDNKTVQALSRALNDRDETVQVAVVDSLRRLATEQALDVLCGKLFQDAGPVLRHVAKALDSLGWRPQNNAQHVRYLVATGEIERLVFFGSEAVQSLVNILRDETHVKRVAAAIALGEIRDSSASRPLQDQLKDDDVLVRAAAAYALSRMACRDAVPKLAPLLRDNDRHVRLAAVTALGSTENPDAVPPLLTALKDSDWEIRATALESLGRLGDLSASQSVAGRLQDNDDDVREMAANTLGRVGDESVIEKLVLTVVDKNSHVRQAATRALNRIDPDWENSHQIRNLLPAIHAAASDHDTTVRTAASVFANRVTGPKTAKPSADETNDPAALQALTVALQYLIADPDPLLRLTAVEFIKHMRLAHCGNSLKALAHDADENVRNAAQITLDSLGPEPTRAQRAAAEASFGIERAIICSEDGKVLSSVRCDNIQSWSNTIESVLEQSRQLAQQMVVGNFDRQEILAGPSRIVLTTLGGYGVMVQVALDSATNIARTEILSNTGAAFKAAVTGWMHHAPLMRGVLMRGLRFADNTIVCDDHSQALGAEALYEAYRCIGEVYARFDNSGLRPTRLQWNYDRTVILTARRDDGAILSSFVSLRATDIDWTGMDHQLTEFCETKIVQS